MFLFWGVFFWGGGPGGLISTWHSRWAFGRADQLALRSGGPAALSAWHTRCNLRPGTPAARVYQVSVGMALRAREGVTRGNGERCGARVMRMGESEKAHPRRTSVGRTRCTFGLAHPLRMCTRLVKVWTYGPVRSVTRGNLLVLWTGTSAGLSDGYRRWLSDWHRRWDLRPGTPAARVYQVSEEWPYGPGVSVTRGKG